MQKKLIYILLLISLFSLTFGCQTESYDFGREDSSIEVLEDGRLRVPILLHIPEREVVETKNNPPIMTDAEKAVKTVDVCVFDAASGNRLEKVSGVIDPNNPLRVFATVLPRNVACKVQVYVNISTECREAFNAAETLEAVQALTMSKTIFGSTANGLPMVSELKEYDKLYKKTLENQVAKLTFAYARIDVAVDEGIKTSFILKKAYVYNAANKGYIIKPESLPIDDITTSPSDSINVDKTTNNINGIYVFENNGELYQEPQGSTPTDLIIKGTNTGFGEGYYKIRIAYEDKDNNNKITYDIRRGVRYAVKITSVKGPGYTSAKEAEENEPSNVEVDITVDDVSSKDVVISNGKYYLGVSNSEYIIYADDARGVIPVTITHNAPSTVTNAKITLSGAGMSFSSSLQPELLNVNNNKEATIKQPDDFVHTIPLRIDFAAGNFEDKSFTEGFITIRIGDLEKKIKVVRKASIPNRGDVITDFVNDDILVIRSHSDRIVVNGSSLTIKDVIESNEKDKLYSIAEAFAQHERGTIVIAIKKNISSVVYYEKYGQKRYGIYSESGVISTLSSSEIILEAGYGVFVEKNIGNNINIQFGGATVPVDAIQSYFVANSDFYLYPVSQNHTALSSQSDLTALEVKINSQSTSPRYYIYPNFAKGVYSTASITDGAASASPFVIRTPKQFRNINTMADNTEFRFFKQERDLDFSDEKIGGKELPQKFTSAIIANEFKGNYDGNIKKIRNLNISGGDSPSLFKTNRGNIENIHFVGFSIVGETGNTALIAATNSSEATINNCLIEGRTDKIALIRGNSTSYTGTVAGVNSGTISNISIVDHNTKNNISFVSGYGNGNGNNSEVGGVVGNNTETGRLRYIIYLAYPPESQHYYPITGSYKIAPEKCYYKRYDNTSSDIKGGGDPLRGKPDMGSTLWVDMSAYPYKKLKDFPTPTWPVAD